MQIKSSRQMVSDRTLYYIDFDEFSCFEMLRLKYSRRYIYFEFSVICD